MVTVNTMKTAITTYSIIVWPLRLRNHVKLIFIFIDESRLKSLHILLYLVFAQGPCRNDFTSLKLFEYTRPDLDFNVFMGVNGY